MPLIHPTAWIAPTATVLFDVSVGARSSVWYQCVIRGDADRVTIGEDTNIQDLSMVHVDEGVPCAIGSRVSIGHRAVIHGCTLEDDALIGMGAIILNGAVIGAGSVVGAGALVREGQVVPPGVLVVGSPARVVRPVDPDLAARRAATWAHYVRQSARHREHWATG